jgi:hypothetical protein
VLNAASPEKQPIKFPSVEGWLTPQVWSGGVVRFRRINSPQILETIGKLPGWVSEKHTVLAVFITGGGRPVERTADHFEIIENRDLVMLYLVPSIYPQRNSGLNNTGNFRAIAFGLYPVRYHTDFRASFISFENRIHDIIIINGINGNIYFFWLY